MAAAQRGLEARIDALARAFNGDVGIAVKDLQTGWTTHYEGDTPFPQQSVSKFWVTLTARNQIVGMPAHGRPHITSRQPTVRQPNRVKVDTRTGGVVIFGEADHDLQVIPPSTG